MSDASTAAKKRWNKAHYAEIKASLGKELVEQFKAKCKSNEVSIASVLAALMSEYSGADYNKNKNKEPSPHGTRPQRRRLASAIASQLNDMLQSEIAYRDNMPANLQDSARAESADYSIEKLEDALAAIQDAY